METTLPGQFGPDVAAQAFATAKGKRLLLINKRNHPVDLTLPSGSDKASALAVDVQSGEGPARSIAVNRGKITLDPFAVTVVSW